MYFVSDARSVANLTIHMQCSMSAVCMQEPELLIDRYNNVIAWLADIASHHNLQQLSWPVPEFSGTQPVPCSVCYRHKLHRARGHQTLLPSHCLHLKFRKFPRGHAGPCGSLVGRAIPYPSNHPLAPVYICSVECYCHCNDETVHYKSLSLMITFV